MIQRSFRYRLYPTEQQAEQMAQTAGAVRFVYNLALEQRRDFWRQASAHGHLLNRFSQGREVTLLRKEVPWLAAVSVSPLQYALADLDRAFLSFWKGGGFPGFRDKCRNVAFREKGRDVRLVKLSKRWSLVRIPKIGMVKMRDTRPWAGRIVSATFKQDGLGWHVSLSCEVEYGDPANDLPAVGIDRGIANTLALSTGEMISAPDLASLERRRKRAQRILARRVRGSARYRKQRRRVAAIAAKLARCRKHWQHEATTNIARRFCHVALEALRIPNMTAAGRGKRGLNRTILEQGWGAIEAMLVYKLEERGGTLAKVDPAYTSQECSACGTVDSRSRESQARFACLHCGAVDHADTNAAKNILRRSTAFMLAEGSGYAPDEARTVNLAA